MVMEAQEQEAASILLTGCKKTLGQVVSGFPLVKRPHCFQVLAGLLTWWLGGLGGEGGTGSI